MSSTVAEIPAIWIAGASCSGCSVSLLNTINPGIRNVLVDPVLPGKHVSLKFHATVMAGQGEPVIQILKDTSSQKPKGYVLIIEGSIPTAEDGMYCTLGELEGKELTMKDITAELAEDALAVLAVGTCSSFGGIPAGGPNPTGAVSAMEFFKSNGIATPLINVPGCPPHPDWIVGTIAGILLNGLPSEDDIDEKLRPRAFYNDLIHDNCPRRAYFDAGQFARNTSEPGCLYEIGCKGPYTYADCPDRQWNNGVSWCIGAGAQCIGCVEPDFPDKFAPLFKKIDEEALDKFKIKTR